MADKFGGNSLQKALRSRFLIGSTIPTSGQEVSAVLSAAIREVAGSTTNSSNVVTATIENPPNIELIDADLSGLAFNLSGGVPASARNKVSTDVKNEVDRLPAIIDKVVLNANPIEIDGIPANLHVDLVDVPFFWVTDSDEKVWFGVEDKSAPELTGSFSAVMEKSALNKAAFKAAAFAAEQRGFKLVALDMDIEQSGTDFVIKGEAKLRKSILQATAQATVVATYDPKTLTLIVKQIDIGSSNPAVGMVLRMAEDKIAAYRGKVIDLNKELTRTGQQLTELDITVGPSDVSVSGKF